METVSSLVSLQAQEAEPPYTALWARIGEFARSDLTAAMTAHAAVRASGFRSTIQLMTAADYLRFYPLVQDRWVHRMSGYLPHHPDPAVWVPRVRQAMAGHGALTGPELKRILGEVLPGYPPQTWTAEIRMVLGLVRVPRRGPESDGPRDYWMTAEEFFRADIPTHGDVEGLVRAYMRAYGPATVADCQWFTGLTGLSDVFRRMDLTRYRDAAGRVLFDAPESGVTDEQAPAPARLLAAFDHAILGHADRTRIVPEAYRRRMLADGLGIHTPTMLHDGMVAGVWHATRHPDTPVLSLCPFEELPRTGMQALEEEADRYGRWRWPGRTVEVVVHSAD
jgi:hypothetical protein